MLVSIVVPAYNAEQTLAACLESCCAQDYHETEVIVVDDGSIDATAEIATAYPVTYVHQENAGPAAARNRGASEASGNVIAFTDSDCVPEPQWIRMLIEKMGSAEAVGGTYTILNDSSILARMVQTEIACRHSRFGDEVDFLGSFNVAYRKTAFDAVDGFDEDFKAASGEDNDIAYKLHNSGCKLIFAPDARVGHYHPERITPYFRTQMWHGYWRMMLYAKHPGKAGGDKYAGTLDLLAPPLALIVMLMLSVLPAMAFTSLATLSFSVSICTLLGFMCLHIPFSHRLARYSGSAEMYLFTIVSSLRDMARAIGMLRGVWVFLINRRGMT